MTTRSVLAKAPSATLCWGSPRGGRLLALSVTLASALLVPSMAEATTSKFPVKRVDRTLTTPDSTLKLDAGERWPYYDGQFKHVAIEDAGDLQFINPGLTFGITPDFELGFVTPVRVEPGTDFEDPRVHLLYQFERGRVDLGLFAGVRVGAFGNWRVTGGVPVFFHWKDNLRLDTGGFLQFNFDDATYVSLTAPAEFVFQITPNFFLGPETGVTFVNMFNNGFDLVVPVGGVIGFSIDSTGGLLGDMYARVRTPDIEASNVLEVMLGLEFYFDL